MVAPVLYKLYGLPGGNNPYTPNELDPLKDPEHLQLILRTGPFDALNEVEVYLDQCVKQGTTAFILVTGESGTGRSSVARAIIAIYREKLLAQRASWNTRFFLPAMPPLNEDPFTTYSRWFYNLRNVLYFKRNLLTPPSGFFEDLDKVYETRTKDDFDSKLQQLLGDVSNLLSNQQEPTGFGMLMEMVPNPAFILAAKQMFEFSRAVCVFTVPSGSDAIVTAFSNSFSNQPPHLIRLEGIHGEVLGMLLKARWNGANPYPFNEDGIKQVFNQPVPIGKALYIVSEMLDVRALERRDQPPWPGNTALLFTQDDLLLGLQYFSKKWR